jgi:hypothetical protein
VLSALLLYFGYARTSTYFSYYGVPLEVLGLSPTDYLLSSPDSLFKPFVAATMAALVFCLAAYFLQRVRRKALGEREVAWRGAGLDVLARCSRAGGFSRILKVKLSNGRIFLHAIRRRPWSALDSLCVLSMTVLAVVGAGIGLRGLQQKAPAEYAAVLLALSAGLILILCARHRESDLGGSRFIAAVAVLGALQLFGAAFWGVTVYATHLGREEAENNFEELPVVTVYAKSEVMLAGAKEARTKPGAQWKYFYPGYRLLHYTNGRWVITHKVADVDHWGAPEKLETFILPRDDTNFVIQITDPRFSYGDQSAQRKSR